MSMISYQTKCKQLFGESFTLWTNGDRPGAIKRLRGAAMLYSRTWADMMIAASPPPGFMDDMVTVNEYDEYVIKENK